MKYACDDTKEQRWWRQRWRPIVKCVRYDYHVNSENCCFKIQIRLQLRLEIKCATFSRSVNKATRTNKTSAQRFLRIGNKLLSSHVYIAYAICSMAYILSSTLTNTHIFFIQRNTHHIVMNLNRSRLLHNVNFLRVVSFEAACVPLYTMYICYTAIRRQKWNLFHFYEDACYAGTLYILHFVFSRHLDMNSISYMVELLVFIFFSFFHIICKASA